MQRQAKQPTLPFLRRNSRGKRCSSAETRKHARSDGYALLIVMMMAAVLMVSLGAALPSIYMEGQREKETELIFRGEQYARAIELYHAQFNRYPSSVKELLHTNDLSFLRRAYRDPMTKSGKWRFIHATASGIILDSKLMKPQNRPSLNNSNSNSNSQTNVNSQTPNADNPESDAAGSKDQNNNGSGSDQDQNSFNSGGFSLFGNQNAQPQSGAGTNSESPPDSDSQANGTSSFFGGQPLGTYIVGVASTSNKRSIRKFENQTEYDDWEFLGIPGAPGAPVSLGAGGMGAGAGAQGAGGQSGQPSPGSGSPANPILVPNP